MANVLGELFADIAEAIRGKTGETGSMKPIEFPEKIAGIEAGGGSGGGGSLPAGVYLTPPPETAPTTYRYKRFMYNGELYAGAGGAEGAGYLQGIYKWNGTAWTKIVTAPGSKDVSDSYIDSQQFHVAEYNGKAHIINEAYHSVFDGSTVTTSTKVPKSGAYPVVYNGKLYAISYSNKIMYEWDEDNSAWITGDTLTSFADCPFVRNGVLYYIGYASGYKVFKYEDGQCVALGALVGSYGVYACGELYTYKKSYARGQLYRFDFETNTEVPVGYLPASSYLWFSENMAEELSFAVITYSTTKCCTYFVATVIEETE